MPQVPEHQLGPEQRYSVVCVTRIATVADDSERFVIRRLFAEYRRGVERLLDGTDICP
jgi:hypothetical protein